MGDEPAAAPNAATPEKGEGQGEDLAIFIHPPTPTTPKRQHQRMAFPQQDPELLSIESPSLSGREQVELMQAMQHSDDQPQRPALRNPNLHPGTHGDPQPPVFEKPKPVAPGEFAHPRPRPAPHSPRRSPPARLLPNAAVVPVEPWHGAAESDQAAHQPEEGSVGFRHEGARLSQILLHALEQCDEQEDAPADTNGQGPAEPVPVSPFDPPAAHFPPPAHHPPPTVPEATPRAASPSARLVVPVVPPEVRPALPELPVANGGEGHSFDVGAHDDEDQSWEDDVPVSRPTLRIARQPQSNRPTAPRNPTPKLTPAMPTIPKPTQSQHRLSPIEEEEDEEEEEEGRVPSEHSNGIRGDGGGNEHTKGTERGERAREWGNANGLPLAGRAGVAGVREAWHRDRLASLHTLSSTKRLFPSQLMLGVDDDEGEPVVVVGGGKSRTRLGVQRSGTGSRVDARSRQLTRQGSGGRRPPTRGRDAEDSDEEEARRLLQTPSQYFLRKYKQLQEQQQQQQRPPVVPPRIAQYPRRRGAAPRRSSVAPAQFDDDNGEEGERGNPEPYRPREGEEEGQDSEQDQDRGEDDRFLPPRTGSFSRPDSFLSRISRPTRAQLLRDAAVRRDQARERAPRPVFGTLQRWRPHVGGGAHAEHGNARARQFGPRRDAPARPRWQPPQRSVRNPAPPPPRRAPSLTRAAAAPRDQELERLREEVRERDQRIAQLTEGRLELNAAELRHKDSSGSVVTLGQLSQDDLSRLREDMRMELEKERSRADGDQRMRLSDLEGSRAELEREVARLKVELHESQEQNAELLRSRVEWEAGRQERGELERERRRLQDEARALEHRAAALRKEGAEFDLRRRHMHNMIQELRGNIRVFCRVRPNLDQPGNDAIQVARHETAGGQQQLTITTQHPGRHGTRQRDRDFVFDRVFQGSDQVAIFEEISQLVQSALDGYHVCIFAYGQTGSGKTFTMEGEGGGSFTGVIPRSFEKIFACTQEMERSGRWRVSLECRYVEIYNEELYDLLASHDGDHHHHHHHGQGRGRGRGGGGYRDAVRVKDPHHLATSLEGARLVRVSSREEVQSLLRTASAARAVAETDMHARSSRSHSVFQLTIQGTNGHESVDGKLNLVDLAGSERLSRSHSRGERLGEAKHINRSLSCLADVISALANKEAHVPYRNSKLTFLLQESLQGDNKVLMFCNVAPEADNALESLCTLRFAETVGKAHIGTAKKKARVDLASVLERPFDEDDSEGWSFQ